MWGSTKLKQTTLNSLKRLYEKLEVITRELYDLAEIELELEDFDDASLLQTRADILYEQMENLDVVISELEGWKMIVELKAKIKELGKLAAELSRQSVEVSKVNRKQGLDLMRQARDASKQCQALIQELKNQQAA